MEGARRTPSERSPGSGVSQPTMRVALARDQALRRFAVRFLGAIMGALMNTRTRFHNSSFGAALALCAALFLLPTCESAAPSRPIPKVARTPVDYPAARLGDDYDDYHGTRVADPYRWLEDPDSQETRHWVDAQVRVCDAYFAGIPQRAALRQRIERLWDYEKFDPPEREG